MSYIFMFNRYSWAMWRQTAIPRLWCDIRKILWFIHGFIGSIGIHIAVAEEAPHSVWPCDSPPPFIWMTVEWACTYFHPFRFTTLVPLLFGVGLTLIGAFIYTPYMARYFLKSTNTRAHIQYPLPFVLCTSVPFLYKDASNLSLVGFKRWTYEG